MTISTDLLICFLGRHGVASRCGCTRSTRATESISEASSQLNATSDPTEDHRYSTEELVEWAESFKPLINSTKGRRLFSSFLKSEYSQENIMFYEACIDLEQTEDEDEIFEKIRNIYRDYVSVASPTEVSLTYWIRDEISEKMLNPDKYIYETARQHVYRVMLTDSYPRFKNSSIYMMALEKSRLRQQERFSK